MSDTLQAGSFSIPATPLLPRGQNFSALQSAALASLQEWCQGSWTDFNPSDPGTIALEQLLYALTELSYRAGLPVPQLLAQADGTIDWKSNSLFAPADILPTEPLTANDYARLVYDRFPEFVHVSIAPLTPDAKTIAPKVAGRLEVDVTPDPDVAQAIVAERISELESMLAHRRNLGERFEPIVSRQLRRFTLELEMDVAAEETVPAIAAACYFAVKRALLPSPRFETLRQALTTLPMDEALAGPLLTRGIIADAALPAPCSWAQAQALAAQAVFAVDGVRKVRQIKFGFSDGAIPKAGDPPGFFAPIKDVSIAPATADRGTIVSFGGRGTEVQPSAAAQILIASGGEEPARPAPRLRPDPAMLAPRIPDEPATEVGEYYSVQNEFPRCFALHERGLPPDATTLRRAQARQLKGYLLVFEQLMANQLAQLEHTRDFLSHTPQRRTTFVQPLSTVPDVLPLLDGYDGLDEAADPSAQSRHAEAYWSDPANPYLAALHAVAENEAEFLSRRDRVLDHLLARFNESYPPPVRLTYETIANKENLLADYVNLSGGRSLGAALVSSQPATEPAVRPRSGLERKLQLLLRRDTQSSPAGNATPPGEDGIERPDDFYFVFESIQFLPSSVTPAPAGTTPWDVPAREFAPTLFHVFINWTYGKVTPAFAAYVESLVGENAPAHLWHRFIWLNPLGERAPADVEEFRALQRDWAAEHYPSLVFAGELPPSDPNAPPPPIPVRRDTTAARLFTWLLDRSSDPPVAS